MATAARAFNVPVILSTVGVKIGVKKPTIASLQSALPGVIDIDRTTMNAWEDAEFLAAVKATGRTKLVMAGIVTSVCLTYPVVDALADGFEVGLVETRLRFVQATARHRCPADDARWRRSTHDDRLGRKMVPRLAAPLADPFRNILIPYLDEMAKLRRTPQYHQPKGATAPAHA